MLLVQLTNDNINQYFQQNIPTQDCCANNSSNKNLYKLQQVIEGNARYPTFSNITQSPEIGGVGIPPREHLGASTLEGLAGAFAFARDIYML